ncbi:mycothiol system anti-sigma-R factor [Corynebacterium crudilactis]|uniref:mycothiol system anti-sigma-R factor n=1 Tax=Corynebacterium crudilactis TaxID=1652495 RepID=UPI00093F5570|nr:mycothiol system anti-sigma-R factor [Corynebacterium crudilactis]
MTNLNRSDSQGDCGCPEFFDDMHQLLDDQLGEAACERLRIHASGCPKCRQLLEAESEFRSLLRKCCCESAPVELRQRISYRIRVEYRQE